MATFTRTISAFVVIPIIAVLLAGATFADDVELIKPNTPQAALALTRLREAEHIDQANYQAFLGSRENTVAMYYLVKHRHVVEAIKQLEAGEPVPADEIKSALDTSEAWRYGSTF